MSPNFSRPGQSQRYVSFSSTSFTSGPDSTIDFENRTPTPQKGRSSSYHSEGSVDEIDEKQRHLLIREDTFRSVSDGNHPDQKFYCPTSNRTWVLASFLFAIAVCIVFLELALAVHGSASSSSALIRRDVIPDVVAHDFPRRQTSDSLSSTSQTMTTISSIVGSIDPASQQTLTTAPTTSDSLTGVPNPASQQTLTTQSSQSAVTLGEPAPESQQSLTSNSGGQSVVAPAPSSQQSLTQASSAKATSASQAVAASQQGSSGEQAAAPTSIADVKGDANTNAASSADLGATSSAASGTSSNTNGAVQYDSPASANSAVGTTAVPLMTKAITYSSDGQVFTSSSVITAAASYSSSLSTFTSSGKVYTSTVLISMQSLLTSSYSTYTSNGHIYTTSRVYAVPVPHITHSALPGSGVDISGSDDSSSSGNSTSVGEDVGKHSPGTITQWQYFLAMYLPSIMGIALQSAWLVVFVTFKMMEPFYQMAAPRGATAAQSLLADYLSDGLSSSVFKAVGDGHWVMLLAGQVQFLLAVILAIVSEAMTIVPTAYCKTEISDHQPCNPKWTVNLAVMRAIETLLIICFSVTVSIMFMNRKRVSGVCADPSKISSMADLLAHRPLLQEIRDLPPNATKEQIEVALEGSRYMLGSFETTSGGRHYGIIKLDTGERSATELVKRPSYKTAFKKATDAPQIVLDKLSNLVPFFDDILVLLLLFTLFVIILAFTLMSSGSKSPLNIFMNSNKFGPTFVLSSFCVLISFLLKRKERSLRLSSPYRLMAERPSKSAKDTIIAGLRGTQFTSFYKSLRHGEFVLAFMALAAILPDVLVLLVPGIPFTTAQTQPVYLASTYCSLTLIPLIAIGQIWAMIDEWRKKKHALDHRTHECPENLAMVLQRICGAHFVEEKFAQQDGSDAMEKEVGKKKTVSVIASELASVKEDQERRYAGVNGEKRYKFAFMKGADGVERWTVDEDVYRLAA